MHEDITFRGKSYRIIVEPVSVVHPEAPRAAVFVRKGGELHQVGNVIQALPAEREEDVLERAREAARKHAESA